MEISLVLKIVSFYVLENMKKKLSQYNDFAKKIHYKMEYYFLKKFKYSSLKLSKHPILFIIKFELFRQNVKKYMKRLLNDRLSPHRLCQKCLNIVPKFNYRDKYKCHNCSELVITILPIESKFLMGMTGMGSGRP